MRRIALLLVGFVASPPIFAGCSAGPADVEDEPVAATTQALCPIGLAATDAMLVLLANAMAKELGRWEFLTDFRLTTPDTREVLALSQAGVDRCRLRGGCPIIQQILAFQSLDLDQVFQFADGTRLSAWSFGARLVMGYRATRDCYNEPRCRWESHRLSFVSREAGTCAAKNTFSAQLATGGNLVFPEMLVGALEFTGGRRNPFLEFSNTSTSVSIGAGLEFEPGPPYACVEYKPLKKPLFVGSRASRFCKDSGVMA